MKKKKKKKQEILSVSDRNVKRFKGRGTVDIEELDDTAYITPVEGHKGFYLELVYNTDLLTIAEEDLEYIEDLAAFKKDASALHYLGIQRNKRKGEKGYARKVNSDGN